MMVVAGVMLFFILLGFGMKSLHFQHLIMEWFSYHLIEEETSFHSYLFPYYFEQNELLEAWCTLHI